MRILWLLVAFHCGCNLWSIDGAGMTLTHLSQQPPTPFAHDTHSQVPPAHIAALIRQVMAKRANNNNNINSNGIGKCRDSSWEVTKAELPKSVGMYADNGYASSPDNGRHSYEEDFFDPIKRKLTHYKCKPRICCKEILRNTDPIVGCGHKQNTRKALDTLILLAKCVQPISSRRSHSEIPFYEESPLLANTAQGAHTRGAYQYNGIADYESESKEGKNTKMAVVEIVRLLKNFCKDLNHKFPKWVGTDNLQDEQNKYEAFLRAPGNYAIRMLKAEQEMKTKENYNGIDDGNDDENDSDDDGKDFDDDCCEDEKDYDASDGDQTNNKNPAKADNELNKNNHTKEVNQIIEYENTKPNENNSTNHIHNLKNEDKSDEEDRYETAKKLREEIQNGSTTMIVPRAEVEVQTNAATTTTTSTTIATTTTRTSTSPSNNIVKKKKRNLVRNGNRHPTSSPNNVPERAAARKQLEEPQTLGAPLNISANKNAQNQGEAVKPTGKNSTVVKLLANKNSSNPQKTDMDSAATNFHVYCNAAKHRARLEAGLVGASRHIPRYPIKTAYQNPISWETQRLRTPPYDAPNTDERLLGSTHLANPPHLSYSSNIPTYPPRSLHSPHLAQPAPPSHSYSMKNTRTLRLRPLRRERERHRELHSIYMNNIVTAQPCHDFLHQSARFMNHQHHPHHNGHQHQSYMRSIDKHYHPNQYDYQERHGNDVVLAQPYEGQRPQDAPPSSMEYPQDSMMSAEHSSEWNDWDDTRNDSREYDDPYETPIRNEKRRYART